MKHFIAGGLTQNNVEKVYNVIGVCVPTEGDDGGTGPEGLITMSAHCLWMHVKTCNVH